MNTPSLFDVEVAPARATDPETSHEAAGLHRARRVTDRQWALALLRDAGSAGLTDFELGELMSRQQTSAGKRRGELVAAGLVEWSGRFRAAPSGAKARVWRAVS